MEFNLRQLFAIVTLSLVTALGARADNLYTYTDEDGVLHVSTTPYHNNFKRIPSRHLPAQTEESALDPKIPLHIYSPIIKNAADLYEIEEALLHAVIKTESAYNAQAISRKGAIGLMQLMPATAKRYGVTNAFDPTENIQGGTRYLKDLMAKFNNNLRLVLAAYNAGEMAVLRHGNNVPPYRETQKYVPTVMKQYQAFSGCEISLCKPN